MITITKNGNAVLFEFEENQHYLYNGTIEVPLNSLSLVTDESEMFTFKKAATNDIFISARYDDVNMSKSQLIDFYIANMVGSGNSESGITSGDVQTMIDTSLEDYYDIDEIDAALSGKADSSAVTEAITAAVSGKADSSSVYTKSEVDAALDDKADSSAVTQEISAAVSGKADTSAVTEAITASVTSKVDTSAITTSISSASTDTQVPSAKAVYDSNPWFILQNPNNSNRGVVSKLAEYYDTNIGEQSYIFGSGNPWSGQPIMARGQYSYAFGLQTSAMTQGAVAEGRETLASALFSHSEGNGVKATNETEHSQGGYNVSNKANGTWGDSGNTLFSVGNGTADNARHNAFEIRQDGSIYIPDLSNGTSFRDRPMIKLQDALGGGSITIDPSLDSGSTNAVANSAITNALDSKIQHIKVDNANWIGSGVTYLASSKNESNWTSFTYASNINNKSILGQSYNSVNQFSLIETSAITTSITSSSTDAQVPSAKAVYDALQESGGGGVSESAFTSYSAATDARLSEDEEITAAALNALNDGKQDTLIAGSGITISGNVISAEGGNLVIELTQAEYDALVDKDPNAFYIITDATEINISDYYTSAQTQSAINSAVSGKQDTLIAGSGITISGNVISANGGGSITVDTALDSGSTNPVENRVIYDKFDEVEQVTAAALNALNDKFDGLRLKKLTQSEYDALTTKDDNTLYVIVN